nr:hypothetical protein [uncultured Dysgonomonas sp.]
MKDTFDPDIELYFNLDNMADLDRMKTMVNAKQEPFSITFF